MVKRRILFTNVQLLGRSGSELFTRELARGCVRRGHDVVAFSRRLGPLAETMRAEGSRVCDSLEDLPWRPDVIHAQHALEALAAIGRFPDVPALYVCHDARVWLDAAPPLPSIGRVAAVDEYCRERVARDAGVSQESVAVIPNGIDLDVFCARAEPLPEKPRRALLFVSGARETRHLDAVRNGCRAAGISLDEIGTAVGRVVEHPETWLPRYDLVFAKARCALEAMAVGAAVVLVGSEGLGPMVRPESFDGYRRRNFGRSLLREGEFRDDALVHEIERYDPEAAGRVQARVRAECGLDPMVESYLSLYEELLADPPPPSTGPLVAYLATLAHEAAQWSRPFEGSAPPRRRRPRQRGFVRRLLRRVRHWHRSRVRVG